MDLDINNRDSIIEVGPFDKRESFFSVVRMSNRSTHVLSNIVYSAMGAESFRIARARGFTHSQLKSNNLLDVWADREFLPKFENCHFKIVKQELSRIQNC